MARYHITLKDSETGAVLIDAETESVVGAFNDADEESVGTLIVCRCPASILAHTTFMAARAVQEVQDQCPQVRAVIAAHLADYSKGGTDND